jgi:hypothetical protein
MSGFPPVLDHNASSLYQVSKHWAAFMTEKSSSDISKLCLAQDADRKKPDRLSWTCHDPVGVSK